MKRFLVAILAILYITTATGANLHFHYCMGQFAGWSFWQDTEHQKCGECGMEKKVGDEKGCCKDEYQQVKIKVDQKTNTSEYSQLIVNAGYHHIINYKVGGADGYQSNISSIGKFTPPWKDQPSIYIRCCNYRI